jgi:hypothetical protein
VACHSVARYKKEWGTSLSKLVKIVHFRAVYINLKKKTLEVIKTAYLFEELKVGYTILALIIDITQFVKRVGDLFVCHFFYFLNVVGKLIQDCKLIGSIFFS